MAKKKSTETAENAVVNQESKEPKKKQEDILLEMIQRYRISHTKNGIFIHMMHRHCPAGIFFKVLSRNVERVSPFRLWLQ